MSEVRLELMVCPRHDLGMAARYGVRVWLALVTVYLVWGSTFLALAIVIRISRRSSRCRYDIS